MLPGADAKFSITMGNLLIDESTDKDPKLFTHIEQFTMLSSRQRNFAMSQPFPP